MEREKIFLKLEDILENGIGTMKDIEESDRFKEDLGFDSVDMLDFTMKVEKEFLVDIENGFLENDLTVKDFLDLLEGEETTIRVFTLNVDGGMAVISKRICGEELRYYQNDVQICVQTYMELECEFERQGKGGVA